MKKLTLTILYLTLFTACQSPYNKKVEQTSPQELLVLLNECHTNSQCRGGFGNKLNSWLIENNYISIEQQVVTDKEINKQITKNVTFEGSKLSNKAILSKDYMSNQLVKGAINEWLTWKRPQLVNTWQYYQYLKADIYPALAQYNIKEPFILAIMAQESGGKVHSSSRAGAGGLFQIMPATAKRLGLNGKKGNYDLRFNPKASAVAAAKYIDEQWQLYNGDKAKILAAYNSGENRFARLNKYHHNKSLWDKNFYYELPRETRHYIPTVIAAMLIFQNPEQFNVVLSELDAETLVVSFANETSLSELSICLGQEQRVDGWFRVLRNLNSGIKADKSIKANTDIKIPKILEDAFNTKCQNKELMKLAKSFHQSDFKGNQGLFRYRVKQGDSLSRIVRKFRCTSKKEIARINKLKSPSYLIRAGKHLKIPQC